MRPTPSKGIGQYRSKPVAERLPDVGIPDPLVRGAGGIAADHFSRLPARQSHEVLLLPAAASQLWAKVWRNWCG
jgi:hypothetical protein